MTIQWSDRQKADDWAPSGHSVNLRWPWLATLVARIGNRLFRRQFRGVATRCDVRPKPAPEGTFRWLPDKYIGRDEQ